MLWLQRGALLLLLLLLLRLPIGYCCMCFLLGAPTCLWLPFLLLLQYRAFRALCCWRATSRAPSWWL